MIYYKDYDYEDINTLSFIHNVKGEKYCNDIFTFDIETSSAFFIKGKWRKFYFTLDADYYKKCKKIAWCYIWQFSINETVIYGRSLEEFKIFFDKLLSLLDCKIIVYCHNLQYEFQFLRNIFAWENVFARKKRAVMKAEYKNSTFKCSYFLSRMSLATISREVNKVYTKVENGLRYDLLRFSDTKLTDLELLYCEMDCLALYEFLLNKRIENENNILNIPLTQTGQVRKRLKKIYRNNKEYHYYCMNRVPTVNEYLMLKECFWGGLTRANATWTEYIVKNVKSYDITSSYPYCMLVEKYPCEKFINIIDKSNNSDYENMHKKDVFRHLNELVKEDEVYTINVSFHNIQSINPLKYIASSKVISGLDIINDNGRIAKADMINLTMTNVDFELINKLYDYEYLDICELFVAKCNYLDNDYRELVTECFEMKNAYKYDDSHKQLYLYYKEMLNSLYGMMVTNIVQPDIVFTDKWEDIEPVDFTFIEEVLKKLKKNYSNLTLYSNGVWVTAYARKNLVNAILSIGDDFVYCDTDSVKFINNHEDFFNTYNENVIKKLQDALQDSEWVERLSFMDKGVKKYIGQYDYEETYKEFKTYGAKKYGVLHEVKNKKTGLKEDKILLTVSGLSKTKASESIKNLKDFTLDRVFSSKESGRMIMHYIEDAEPCVIRGRYIDSRYSIVSQPTTYCMSISKEYEEYLIACETNYTEYDYLNNRKEFYKHEKEI